MTAFTLFEFDKTSFRNFNSISEDVTRLRVLELGVNAVGVGIAPGIRPAKPPNLSLVGHGT